jgi:hypothetical protein
VSVEEASIAPAVDVMSFAEHRTYLATHGLAKVIVEETIEDGTKKGRRKKSTTIRAMPVNLIILLL